MTDLDENAVSKVHPAAREMLADDPLSLHGVEVPGDADVMMRMLVEDYARMGWDLKGIVTLARDPFYQAFALVFHSGGQVHHEDQGVCTA